MRVRVTGTREETAAVVGVLAGVLDVREVSGFHPNRGQSVVGRVYLDVAGPRLATVRAAASRADHPTHPTEITGRTP
jgi:hypothetical protein